MPGSQPEVQTSFVRLRVSRPVERDPVDNRAEMVEGFPPFSNVSLTARKEILLMAEEVEFSRRQMLYFEGDPVRQIILLTSGSVKITQVGLNGSEVILRLAGPREVVGAVGGSARINHCSTAKALRT